MAFDSIIGKFSAEGAEQIRAALRGIRTDAVATGEAAAKAFDRLNAKAKDIPTHLRVADSAAKAARQGIDAYASRLGPLGAALTSLGPAGTVAAAGIVGVGAAAAGVGLAFASGIRTTAEFDKSLKNLSAITGATGKDLDFLRERALQLSRESTSSAVGVVEAFKLIASAKPELLANREALAAVGKEAIALSEATGLAVPQAAKVAVTALNQFRVGAEEAGRFVNVLAAGVKLGAAEIPDLETALVKAGTSAKNAKLSFEEFNATLQLLAQFGTPAEQIGTSLRNIFLILDKGGRDTNPRIVGLKTALDNLVPVMADAAKFTKLFGSENVTVARQLIEVRDQIDPLARQLTGTSEAYIQAAKNTDTLEAAQLRLSHGIDAVQIALVGTSDPFKDFVNGMAEAAFATADLIEALGGLPGVVKIPVVTFVGGALGAGAAKAFGGAALGGAPLGALAAFGEATRPEAEDVDAFLARVLGRSSRATPVQTSTVDRINTLAGGAAGPSPALASSVRDLNAFVDAARGGADVAELLGLKSRDAAAALTGQLAPGLTDTAKGAKRAQADMQSWAREGLDAAASASLTLQQRLAGIDEELARGDITESTAQQKRLAAREAYDRSIAKLDDQASARAAKRAASERARAEEAVAVLQAEVAARQEAADLGLSYADTIGLIAERTALASGVSADLAAAEGDAAAQRALLTEETKRLREAEDLGRSLDEQIADRQREAAIYAEVAAAGGSLAEATRRVAIEEAAAKGVSEEQQESLREKAEAYDLATEAAERNRAQIENTNEIGLLEKELALLEQVRAGKLSLTQATTELAIAEKAQAGAFDEAGERQKLALQQRVAIMRETIVDTEAELRRLGQDASDQLARDLSSGLVDAAFIGRDAFADMFDDIESLGKRLAARLLEILVIRPLLDTSGLGGLLGGGTGATGGGGFNVVSLFTRGVGSLTQGIDTLSGDFFDLSGKFDGLTGGIGELTGSIDAALSTTPGISTNPAFAGPPTASTAAGSQFLGGLGGALGGAGAIFGIGSLVGDAGEGGIFNNRGDLGGVSPGTIIGGAGAGAALGAYAGTAVAAYAGIGTALGALASTGIGAIVAAVAAIVLALVQVFNDVRPTGGAVLRRATSKFFENPDNEVPFFANRDFDPQNFTGWAGAQGERLFPDAIDRDRVLPFPTGLDVIPLDDPNDFIKANERARSTFFAGQQSVIDELTDTIGLNAKQKKGFTGFAAAFRAIQGADGGVGFHEPSRTFAVLGSVLDNIADKGLNAAESMQVLTKAVENLGEPSLIFKDLNDFFSGTTNDISIQTYRDAIEGLAFVLFQDVPLGVRASEVALSLLDRAVSETGEQGVVTFQDLEKEIRHTSTAAEAMVAALRDVDFEGVALGGILDTSALDAEIDDFATRLRVAVADGLRQAFFEGMVQQLLQPQLFAPFFAQVEDISTRLREGEITPDEANVEFTGALADFDLALEEAEPSIRAIIAAGGAFTDSLTEWSGALSDSAAAARGFNEGIADQILALRDPEKFQRTQLERAQKQRRITAEEIGGDLVQVEVLNLLERIDLLERLGEEERREAQRLHDERVRLIEQEREAITRAREQIRDLYTDLTASPSSPLSPLVTLPKAQERFFDLLGKAQGGNQAALEAIPDAAQDFLAIARQVFASSPDFFAIFDDVTAALNALGLDTRLPTLPPGDVAIVTAIDRERIALEERLDQLIALYGNDDGTVGADDFVPGRYGLSSAHQQKIALNLAGIDPQGPKISGYRQLLGMTAIDIAAIDDASVLGQLRDGILAVFPHIADMIDAGETYAAIHAFKQVLTALVAKAEHPDVFQPVLGFETGGMFRVGGSGGPDSQLVRFLASPSEYVGVFRGDPTAQLAALAQSYARTSDLRGPIAIQGFARGDELAMTNGQIMAGGFARTVFALENILDEQRALRAEIRELRRQLRTHEPLLAGK